MKIIAIAATAAATLFASCPAFGDEAANLAAIKAQLNTLQREYDGKIRSLESRLAKAEADARVARAAAATATKSATAAQATAQSATLTAEASTTALQQAIADNAPPPAPPADTAS